MAMIWRWRLICTVEDIWFSATLFWEVLANSQPGGVDAGQVFWLQELLSRVCPTGETITKEYYIVVLHWSLNAVHRKRPRFIEPGSWNLHYGNASYSAYLVRQYLFGYTWHLSIQQTMHSLHLAPRNFVLFPKIKIVLGSQC